MTVRVLSHRLARISMFLVLCVFGMALASMAQTSSTGALTGKISDPSGAVVPGATITLTSLATGQSRTAMTGNDGSYNFGLLPPANYSLRIEAAGFKAVVVPSVTVSVTE